MRRLVFVLMLLAVSGEARDRRCRARHARTGECVSYAFFEAFPSSGAGTFGACSTTPPTGAKGEVLTFSRASSATCTRTASGGLATTGIADGDLVTMSTDQPRVMYGSAGALMLGVEAAGTMLLLRFNALTNAAWADVGTPTVVDGAMDPFGGTTGDTITDDDPAAFEGRSQAITVSAGAPYFMYCYVKAGSRAEARISIDGTTQDVTGLSATTWTIVERGDASSSGVSIPIQVLVGDAVGDTGSVIWGGCDVKAGTFRTSIVPTVASTVTRALEDANFAGLSAFASAPLSVAATVEFSGTRAVGAYTTAIASYNSGTAYALLGTNLASVGWEQVTVAATRTSGVASLSTGQRLSGFTTGVGAATLQGGVNGVFGAAVTTDATVSFTNVRIGGWASGGSLPINGLIGLVCVDPSRCAP